MDTSSAGSPRKVRTPALSSLRSPVSLSALEAIQRYLFEAQEKLREVFLNDRPRLEISIFDFVVEIFNHKLKPYLEFKNPQSGSIIIDTPDKHCDTRSEDQILFEGKYVLENVLQDVYCSLLFLISRESIFHTEIEDGSSREKDTSQDSLPEVEISLAPNFYSALALSLSKTNMSPFYVSRSQRVWCAKLFFFLCWTPDVPLNIVLHSLYPLLSHSPTSPEEKNDMRFGSSLQNLCNPLEGLENHVTSYLFKGSQMGWKKKLVMETLNGLLFFRSCGIKNLYKVFILTDRIPLEQGEALKEVAAYIHPLFVSEQRMMWKWDGHSASSSFMRITLGKLAFEDRLRIVCDQMVELFTSHKEEEGEVNDGIEDCVSARCVSQSSQIVEVNGIHGRFLLPQETLEDRLHLLLVLLLNTLLHLPSKSDKSAYALAYQRYFFANKYFLSPAFGPLTLRTPSLLALSTSGDNEGVTQRVADALARLYTLVHGIQLGASTLSLITVLEKVMPGLLNLTALVTSSGEAIQQRAAPKLPSTIELHLSKIWKIFHQDSVAVDFVAEVAARACFSSAAAQTAKVLYRFGIKENCVTGPTVVVNPQPCTSRIFLDGVFKGILSPFFFPSAGPVKDASKNDASCLLQSKTLLSFARHCHSIQRHHQLYLPDSRITDSPDDSYSEEDLEVVTDFLFCYLAEAPASSIFSRNPSLSDVFTVLCLVLPLSSPCLAWSVTLAAQVLEPLALRGRRESSGLNEGFIEFPHKISEKNAFEKQLEKFKILLRDRYSEAVSFSSTGSIAKRNSESNSLAVTLSLLLEEGLIDTVLQKCKSDDNFSTITSSEEQRRSSISGDEILSLSPSLFSLALQERHQAVIDALHSGSPSQLTVTLGELFRWVEECCFRQLRSEIVAEVQKGVGEAVVRTLFQVLGTTAETFPAVSAIQVLCWMGMYRWDAPHTEILADAIWQSLWPPLSSCTPPFSSSLQADHSSDLSSVLPPSERSSMLKVRLLDLLLSWCDYDQEGLTLRYIDNYGQKFRSCTLMDLLALLCKPDQPEVVQVAALHCVGHYFPATYPRVSLWKLRHLCQDVFRSTPVEMAKAACAAMLRHVIASLLLGDEINNSTSIPPSNLDADTQGKLLQQVSFAMQDDEEFKAIHQIATAMSSYYSENFKSSKSDVPPEEKKKNYASSLLMTIGKMPNEIFKGVENNNTSKSLSSLAPIPSRRDDDHAAVIRRHGGEILHLMSLVARNIVVE